MLSPVQLLESDSQAFQAVKQPTLFFMPHCGVSIYHNLLASNWTPERLSKVVMLGNSLVKIASDWSGMAARLKKEKFKPQGVLRLVEANAVVDVPVKECNFPIRGAFNDMSIVFIPGAPDDFSDLEIADLKHLLPKDRPGV